ncbi:glycoside hydrolase family 16 protein [Lichenihabitans psoromatis]|uniref:glycoside hydrolase family 16 protein n=1 Tax=Lichenihabitans psoromatis TaxID=2528642 RepID=UPI0010384599|nr:glycoside hydrolase family 16 protein [Lichenihabitans psoromatis]
MQANLSVLVGSSLVAAILLLSPPRAAAQEAAIDLSHFELAFSDEFDRLDVSGTGFGAKWAAHTSWGGDFGDARFTDPGPTGPFKIVDGHLEIIASKTSAGVWQSGLLSSIDTTGQGFAQQYGYFEMRAKLPSGKGLWPAFWLNTVLPKGSPIPGIEIDVIEHYGHFPKLYQALVHIWPKPPNDYDAARKTVIEVPEGSLYDEFHTYGVLVRPDWITVYLDRKPKWRCPTPPEHKNKLMILANLAMGSGWPIDETPNPSIMTIDYIRAYRERP